MADVTHGARRIPTAEDFARLDAENLRRTLLNLILLVDTCGQDEAPAIADALALCSAEAGRRREQIEAHR